MNRTSLASNPLLLLGAGICVSTFATVSTAGCSDAPKTAPQGATSTDAGADATSPEEEPDAGPDAEPPYDGPAPFDGGPLAPLAVVDLGPVSAGTQVTFEVPAGTLGFHVMVTSTSPSQELAVQSIQAPSGKFVHQNATPVGGDHPTSDTLFGTTASAQVPQGALTEAAVEAGTWKVVFAGRGTLRGKIQLQTTPDGTFHGGILNLNVYIPAGLKLGSAKTINAASAWSRPEVKERFTGFFAAIYDLYGLRNGTVRFFDIPAKYLAIDEQELGVVFKESKAAPAGQAMNIFLSEVDDQGFWWGVAAGIPGAANTPGNDQSGLALASIPQAEPEMEAFVLAHEAGHFFGLNHTTEMQGGVADPLPDTPRCTTIDNGNLESCPDFPNIMFPSGAVMPPIVTSPNQRRVVQGSPVFRAFLKGTAPLPKAFAPAPAALDYGRLFGHPGTPLTRAERVVLGGTCAHPSHVKPALSVNDRSELAQLAETPAVSGPMRGAARRLLAP